LCTEQGDTIFAMNVGTEAIGAMAIRRETAEHPFSTIKA
jgi:hypothetical protein